MELADGYTVDRTLEPGRPPWGRWEVRDATGLLVGVVAEEPAEGRSNQLSTFNVVHNPSLTPFVLRFSRLLRARGAWWSGRHETVSAAVAALAVHLQTPGRGSAGHHMTRSRR